MRLTIVAAGAAIIASAIAVTTAAGTADGTFTVKGKAAKLVYAYATARPDSSDKTKEEITVMLSDVPLTDAVLKDPTPFGLQDLTRADKLHGLSIRVNSSKAVVSTSLYHSAFKFSSVSAAGSNIKLDLKTFDKTTIAGKVYTLKPETFGPDDIPYEYAVTFSAPIAR